MLDRPLPDLYFRKLSAEEEARFRTWAREHTGPDHTRQANILHPIVRDEWTKLGVAF